ncbi:HPP family protein [Gallaecimonas sp. GXIMD4217]|uniref:HPP family protein n=1 Tax=Gallaecimonas sp. GXIMD4217 TaxID=3131927 RepID=UPI00311AF412
MLAQLRSRFLPALVAGLGAACCIGLLALLDLSGQGLWLMAPFGATMVIAFGLPQSPLAQPRNIVLGHLLTSLIGLCCLQLFGAGPAALALACGLGVMAMLVTDTTHPPAGANPLVVMLTGQDWSFLVSPVLTGTVLIVAVAVAYNRGVRGQAYPQRWLL